MHVKFSNENCKGFDKVYPNISISMKGAPILVIHFRDEAAGDFGKLSHAYNARRNSHSIQELSKDAYRRRLS